MRIIIIIALALFGVSSGCASRSRDSVTSRGFDHRIPEEMAWIHQQLETASLADGVSQDEANKLAASYWTRFCSRCGMVDMARDAGDYWKAPVYAGYIASHRGDISIHKSSGYISWNGGPTVTNWSRLWE